MRNSLLASLALAAGALMLSFGVEATPIHVSLINAAGSNKWTSPSIMGGSGGPPPAPLALQPFYEQDLGTITLTGWEKDNGTWQHATMMQTPNVFGLGIQCNPPNAADCTGGQIGSSPVQAIDLNISLLTGWNSLLLSFDSIEGSNTGYLYGATCSPGVADCATTFLTNCTPTNGRCTLNLPSAFLDDYRDIWIMSADLDPISLDANFYVCTGPGPCQVPTSVPEPAALGMFGLGLLLIGAFLGLRRRQTP